MVRRIVLPFPTPQFRSSSVVDRPGEWGNIFDRIVGEVEASGNLVILDEEGEDDTIFAITNGVILDEAQALARQHSQNESESPANQVLAVIVWNGQSRGEGDLTVDLVDKARARAIPVTEILTI